MQNLSHPRIGPLITGGIYRDLKDPCPIFLDGEWHIYGSGGSSVTERWEIIHAMSPTAEGPWSIKEECILDIRGRGIAAPSVTYDEIGKKFHMFVQTHYAALATTIEHLVSVNGKHFTLTGTALRSFPNSDEAGIYDPHTAIIGSKKFLTYSGHPVVGRPDIYLAQSVTHHWDGPWKRLGRILSHYEIEHHNQLDQPDYEWGLEGSQLIKLNESLVLCIGVCFLPQGVRGTRQRVFFSVSRSVEGPYVTLGPVLNPQNNEWESGENGHAAGLIVDNTLYLFYQARSIEKGRDEWRYGLVKYNVPNIIEIAEERLRELETHNAIDPII
jgi:hypothetical protein